MMTELLKSLTFRFVPRPSFWEGIGRAMDIGAGLSVYNVSATPAEADYNAMASDWIMVGQDFTIAVRDYEQKAQKQGQANSK